MGTRFTDSVIPPFRAPKIETSRGALRLEVSPPSAKWETFTSGLRDMMSPRRLRRLRPIGRTASIARIAPSPTGRIAVSPVGRMGGPRAIPEPYTGTETDKDADAPSSPLSEDETPVEDDERRGVGRGRAPADLALVSLSYWFAPTPDSDKLLDACGREGIAHATHVNIARGRDKEVGESRGADQVADVPSIEDEPLPSPAIAKKPSVSPVQSTVRLPAVSIDLGAHALLPPPTPTELDVPASKIRVDQGWRKGEDRATAKEEKEVELGEGCDEGYGWNGYGSRLGEGGVGKAAEVGMGQVEVGKGLADAEMKGVGLEQEQLREPDTEKDQEVLADSQPGIVKAPGAGSKPGLGGFKTNVKNARSGTTALSKIIAPPTKSLTPTVRTVLAPPKSTKASSSETSPPKSSPKSKPPGSSSLKPPSLNGKVKSIKTGSHASSMHGSLPVRTRPSGPTLTPSAPPSP
ncbi:hypothetical protein FRC06_001565 [Ceratobasidium sp. 370]|nr:hypothetical protein FRC06_001565 [Ceratobasidium sp. 370]